MPSGRTDVGVYAAATGESQPLVVIAHGYMRNQANTALMGRRLAQERFVAFVPDLPAWADHARNGRFTNELAGHLAASLGPAMQAQHPRVQFGGSS